MSLPDQSASERPATVGVIAGAGQFPVMVVEGAQAAGHQVIVAGLRGLADPQLRKLADRYYPVGLLRIGSWIRVFKRHGIEQATMAGYVRKRDMYGRLAILRLLPDWLFLRLWFFQLQDRRNDTVLNAVSGLLQHRGIALQDVTRYCQQALAGEGLLGGPAAGPSVHHDIRFGWPVAKKMGALDIGQSIAVKDAEVIAVEAIEGTDRMIARAGELCRKGGWTLIKVAKPDQDMLFDVPTIGPDTITNLHHHGASALVVESGKTVIVDAEQVFAEARRLGISIVGMSEPPQAGASVQSNPG